MLHETVTSVVGLLLKIYLYKHDEDLIKHSNSKKGHPWISIFLGNFNFFWCSFVTLTLQFTIVTLKKRPAIIYACHKLVKIHNNKKSKNRITMTKTEISETGVETDTGLTTRGRFHKLLCAQRLSSRSQFDGMMSSASN